MSFKWPNKDPDEVLDYSVDWSRYLNGATISSYSWYVDNADGVKTLIPAGAVINGIQNIAQTNSGAVVTINLGLGTNNKEYKLTEEQRNVYKNIGGTPRLDATYTVFGEVIEGLEIVDKIAAVQTDANDKPVNDIRIIKIKIIKN